jgi:hypothetical protein
MSNNLDTTIAVKFDFTAKQNQTFNPLLTFVNDDDTPINLSGTIIKMSVRLKHGLCNTGCDPFDSNFNQVYKQDFEPEVTGADNNKIQFNDIIYLAHGLYTYDLLIIWPSGERQYYLKGNFKVERSYTNGNNN